MKDLNSWQSDLGNGMFKNPVLFADYSDPDVIRVGNSYYMTASSFNCTPGLPLLKSSDLVNWKLIGHGIKNVPHKRYKECQPGCGVWAPSIRFRNNVFYIVFPMPDEGLYIIHTENPEGRWSEPHLLLEGKGLIDPCPFWDDDGKAYIVHGFAFSRAGIKSKLRLIEVSTDLKTPLDKGTIIIDAMNRLPTLEGPKMFKHEGFYYISAPAGGVSGGWQMIFRSKALYGPYEEKKVLSQQGSTTNGPHQGALLDDIKGNWWFIHFQDYQPRGRIVHLQPAFWKNGWPMMGIEQTENGVGKPVLQYQKPTGDNKGFHSPADSDDFKGNTMGLQWQWNANHSDQWFELTGNSLKLQPGELKGKDFYLYPQILCQKINGPDFYGRVQMKYDRAGEEDEAGITIVGLQSARIGIGKIDGEYSLIYRINGDIKYSEKCEQKDITFFVEVNQGGFCRFGIIKNGQKHYTGPGFNAVEGRWIGARFGLYCLGNSESGGAAEVLSVKINEEENTSD